jgi:hypothetical protein
MTNTAIGFDPEAFDAIQSEVRLRHAAERAGMAANISRETVKRRRVIHIIVGLESADRIAAMLEEAGR